MKLLYCVHCQDIVRLFSEKRSCMCGKSWGHYLEDNSTTVQTFPSLSIGIANPDFRAAQAEWIRDPNAWSPTITMRSWINPATESDVKFVEGIPWEDGAFPTMSREPEAEAQPQP